MATQLFEPLEDVATAAAKPKCVELGVKTLRLRVRKKAIKHACALELYELDCVIVVAKHQTCGAKPATRGVDLARTRADMIRLRRIEADGKRMDREPTTEPLKLRDARPGLIDELLGRLLCRASLENPALRMMATIW